MENGSFKPPYYLKNEYLTAKNGENKDPNLVDFINRNLARIMRVWKPE